MTINIEILIKVAYMKIYLSPVYIALSRKIFPNL